MPPGQSCPVCGRMFGSTSLAIHLPQCQKKTILQWQNDPATRDRPMPSALAMGLSTTGGSGLRSGGGGAGRTTVSKMPSSTPTDSLYGSRLPSLSGGGGGGGGHQQQYSSQQNRRVGGGGGGATDFGGGGGMMAGGGGGLSQQPLNLVACRFCNRTFSSDRIGKHESVCVGSQRARTTFDTKSQRLRDVMDEMMPGKAIGGPRKKKPTVAVQASRAPMMGGGGGSRSMYSGMMSPKRDWRQEHEEFQAAMRAAKRDAAATKRAQGGGGGAVYSSSRYSGATAGGGGGGRSSGSTSVASRTFQRGISGTRPMAGGPVGGGGGMASSQPKQLGIAPTNDTSAGMWAAMGRSEPTYGTNAYGPIGRRGAGGGGGAARQAQAGGGGGGGHPFW